MKSDQKEAKPIVHNKDWENDYAQIMHNATIISPANFSQKSFGSSVIFAPWDQVNTAVETSNTSQKS